MLAVWSPQTWFLPPLQQSSMHQTSSSEFSPLSRLAGASLYSRQSGGILVSYTIPQVNEQLEEYDIKSAEAEIAEMTALLSKVNVSALRDRATALRKVDCTVPALSYDHESRFSVMGGMNYHIPIHFVDGVTWLCRIRRRNITTTPVAHQNRLILSEAATYQFLSSRTLIPVPKVHDYSIDSPFNPIGVGYILIMDKLEGKPLSDCDLTDADRERVLSQLADVFVALKQHPFNEIGCLLDPDNLSVGPVLDESTIVDADEDGNLSLLGPFKSALEYRTSSIKHQIELILRGECYNSNAIDAYLIHRFILDHVIQSVTEKEQGPFFLKHMDDKGDHILVDDKFRIVGIIDWEWGSDYYPVGGVRRPPLSPGRTRPILQWIK